MCQWLAPRPAAGWIISCEPTRSSGKRMTAPSASVWMASRTAQPWPANRVATTRWRSPESAVPSVKVRYAELCCPSNELRISTHTKCRALLRPCSFSTEPTQHGLIKGGGHSCPGSISVCLWLLGGVIVASHPHYQEHLWHTLSLTLTLQKHLLIYVSVHCLIYVFLGLYVCFFLTGATMCILNL